MTDRLTSSAATSSSLIEGFVAALAWTAAASLWDGRVSSLVPAACVGILFAALASPRAARIRGLVAGLCGLGGSIAAFLDLGRQAQCTDADPTWTVVWGGALVAFALFAALPGIVVFRARIEYAPLALFGALEALSFFVLPLGVSLQQTSSPMIAMLVSFVAALLFGALVGMRPQWALLVFGLLIGLAMLGVTSVWGSACETGPDLWGVGAAAMYFVAFALTRVGAGLISRRR